ncbi:MAG: hypothetical protein Kow0029_14720 [Candidatus Rifleibacteriota bacterium]
MTRLRLGKTALLLLLTPFVTILCGCVAGGGQSTASDYVNGPEAAVQDLFGQMRASSELAFRYDPSGEIKAQEAANTIGYMKFRDMDGIEWVFGIEQVEYEDDNAAEVYTHYYKSGSPQFGGLRIVFQMAKEAGDWFLVGLKVTEIPAVVVVGTGINGAITDKVTGAPVSGARIELYRSSDNQLVAYTVSDSGGYYEFLNLSAGTYYLVIGRDGYSPYTISGVQVL